MLDLFEEAVVMHTCPRRIRTDKGTENVLIWQALAAAACTGENEESPVVTGSSVHNQRKARFNGQISRNIPENYGNVFMNWRILVYSK